MQGNRHYAWASGALENEENAEGSYLNPQEAALRTAAIEATLALAFEQRTANLISFEQGQWAALQNGDLSEQGERLLMNVVDQIAERLGLK